MELWRNEFFHQTKLVCPGNWNITTLFLISTSQCHVKAWLVQTSDIWHVNLTLRTLDFAGFASTRLPLMRLFGIASEDLNCSENNSFEKVFSLRRVHIGSESVVVVLVVVFVLLFVGAVGVVLVLVLSPTLPCSFKQRHYTGRGVCSRVFTEKIEYLHVAKRFQKCACSW